MSSVALEPAINSCTVACMTFDVIGEGMFFTTDISAREIQQGIIEVDLELKASASAVPPTELYIRWAVPAHDTHCCWRPDVHGSIGISPDFDLGSGLESRVARGAPVICLHSTSGENRMCAALNDVLHTTRLWAGIREENGIIYCTATPFASQQPAAKKFRACLRVDCRQVPWRTAVSDVRRWWEAMPGHEPVVPPEAAFRPMYSTWYSMHQTCSSEAVEEQSRLAVELGCESIIVDDGWQTLDTARGYAFTGDWEPKRMGDMRAHVERVHAMGLKYLLWFSLPFIGYNSRSYKKFEPFFLQKIDGLKTAVLDPRFPEVREHLASLYETCVREWNLDGLKLDFIEVWNDGEPAVPGDGRDIADLEVAVDTAMKDIIRRTGAVRPNMMIEFRQPYTGPLMRTYGNLFRASDCPGGILANRARTLQLRMLCQGSAVHADMLMWHVDEPVEAAALQFLAILFAVPQISVDLSRLNAEHSAMLRFWTGWWREHRDVLLCGDIDPRHPELAYPAVRADNGQEYVVAVYSDGITAEIDSSAAGIYVVNATRSNKVVVVLDHDLGMRKITVRNCMGKIVEMSEREFSAGAHVLTIPQSGVVEILTERTKSDTARMTR